MRSESYIFQLQTMHPFWRVVLGLVGLGLLGVFLFFGLVMVAVFAALALVSAGVLAIRGWWLRRKLGGAPREGEPIEGEFIVVERRSIHHSRRPD